MVFNIPFQFNFNKVLSFPQSPMDFEQNHYEGDDEIPGTPGSVGVTDWSNPGTTISDNSYGSFAWANPNNAQASDDAMASFNSASLDSSEYLKCTNFNFSLPLGAVVTGVECAIEHTADFADEIKDDVVKLVIGGAVAGDNKAKTALIWTTTEETYVYGSSADRWGNSITKTQAEAADFGVVLAAKIVAGGGFNTPLVDNIRLRIHYQS